MEKENRGQEPGDFEVTDDTRLEPNEAEAAAKTYDDEVIFMNLTTGVYASIESQGALLWEAIGKRHSLREIAEVLAQHYEVASAQALNDLRELAVQLLREGMVRASSASEPTGATASAASRRPYEAPRLVIYRDMEDLLALDPPLPQYAAAPWTKT